MEDAEMSRRTRVSVVVFAAAFYYLVSCTSVAISILALYLTGLTGML
jgi:hypothetical protein